MSIALGTLPDWFSGIGTTGAPVFAAGALKAAAKANKKQDEQIKYLANAEAARVEHEKREQASQVAMWFDLKDTNSPELYFSNLGGLPIYDVNVVASGPWGPSFTSRPSTVGAICYTGTLSKLDSLSVTRTVFLGVEARSAN